jgi:hypothetical protein
VTLQPEPAPPSTRTSAGAALAGPTPAISSPSAGAVGERRWGRRWPAIAVWAHLVQRFVGSLRPGGPSAADEGWVRRQLLPGEVDLWVRMSGPDRRHAVGVAQRTLTELGDAASRPVLAAALLHDVGKVEAGIGPFRRAVATVAGMAVDRETVGRWSARRRGVRSRFGRYLTHDVIGADLLEGAGSDELTVRWAREHHLPPERWTVAPKVGAALKAADDD